MKLRAQFDNEDETLFPNQFVNARLLVDTLKDATVIPTAAVQRGAPGTFVYLVKPDRHGRDADGEARAAGRRARRGQSRASSLGDQVVVDGADKLRDGAKVSLRQESRRRRHRHRG